MRSGVGGRRRRSGWRRRSRSWWDGSGIGYTQGELADLLKDRCGVEIGRSYISELERSWQQNKMPSLEVAAALAEGLVPTLGGATVTRTWSGLRPGSSDELPILGESTRRGLYVCTGHYRNGILLAPASVEAMAAAMLGRSARVGASAATVPDLTPFHPSRFAR